MGKPHTGLLEGDLTWLGSYDECVATEAAVNISGEITHPYRGRYCTSSFTFEGQKQVYHKCASIRENQTLLQANNKGEDQPAHKCSHISSSIIAEKNR